MRAASASRCKTHVWRPDLLLSKDPSSSSCLAAKVLATLISSQFVSTDQNNMPVKRSMIYKTKGTTTTQLLGHVLKLLWAWQLISCQMLHKKQQSDILNALSPTHTIQVFFVYCIVNLLVLRTTWWWPTYKAETCSCCIIDLTQRGWHTLRWVYIICVRACSWRDLYASIPRLLWYLV